MLITEGEHKNLRIAYDTTVKANTEQGTIGVDVSKEENAPHYSEEFFQNVACIFELIHNYTPNVRPIITPTLKQSFDIPHFGKYKYAILIREEKLLQWGNDMNLIVDSVQATGSTRKLLIFYRILSHEFLHIVEREKGITIFTDNPSVDSEIATNVIQKLINQYGLKTNGLFGK